MSLRTRALAIDAYGPAIAALRRTAQANGIADSRQFRQDFDFARDCLELVERFNCSLLHFGNSLPVLEFTSMLGDVMLHIASPC